MGTDDSPGCRGPVVITGMGAVTPFGWGVEVFAEGLAQGTTAIRPLTLIDTSRQRTRLAGEVPPGGDRWLADLPPRRRRRLIRIESFGLVAAREAAAMAGLDLSGTDTGVFLGTNTGGMLEGERLYREFTTGNPRQWPGPIASNQYNSTADTVARLLDISGPVVTVTAACSASGMAIELAMQSIRSGETEVALAGGADALCELTYSGFNALRVVDAGPCQPFRTARQGLTLGEGAGVIVLESLDHARRRGATILAKLAGAGSSCDAHHMTAPDPDGAGLRQAIEGAFFDAGIGPADVDLINSHGTGTLHNDPAEWQGLTSVFGDRLARLPVMATKASTGHLLGSCGAVEAVATLLVLRSGTLPPTPGGGDLDPECPAGLCFDGPCSLDPEVVARGPVALSVNLAFGGANVALVLRGSPAGDPAGRIP